MESHLTLATALSENRLEDFILQAEKSDIGTARLCDFEDALGRIIAPQQADQTCHLPDCDDLYQK